MIWQQTFCEMITSFIKSDSLSTSVGAKKISPVPTIHQIINFVLIFDDSATISETHIKTK